MVRLVVAALLAASTALAAPLVAPPITGAPMHRTTLTQAYLFKRQASASTSASATGSMQSTDDLVAGIDFFVDHVADLAPTLNDTEPCYGQCKDWLEYMTTCNMLANDAEKATCACADEVTTGMRACSTCDSDEGADDSTTNDFIQACSQVNADQGYRATATQASGTGIASASSSTSTTATTVVTSSATAPSASMSTSSGTTASSSSASGSAAPSASPTSAAGRTVGSAALGGVAAVGVAALWML
ncbi:hypothetical protein JCM10207_006550 [Rhodosporidiobolus poonsookiae]